MNPFWSPIVQELTPYTPGEQPKTTNLIKLNTNENPYGPSARVLQALRSAVGDSLRLYPDPEAEALRQTVARHHGLAPDEVFAGNGSDEVLAFAFQALLRHEEPLLLPDIGYSFYPVYCRLYGIDFEPVPLTDALTIRVDDYDRPCGGIVLANPNAPTGTALPPGMIVRLLERHPERVVLVDEAYVDFGGESVIPLIHEFPNLLVVQTLSKSRSLAGLRVGLAMGQRHLIEALNRVKNSFNSYPLDRLAMAGAIAAYEDEEHFETARRAIIASRTTLVGQLESLGFRVLPSAANFVFASHPARDAAGLASALRERAIIVRHFRQARIEQFLRITVGTPEQCAALTSVLAEILGEARGDERGERGAR
jgi:histidinol-phosphate aminotransferase